MLDAFIIEQLRREREAWREPPRLRLPLPSPPPPGAGRAPTPPPRGVLIVDPDGEVARL